MKKIVILIIMLTVPTMGLFSFELGLIGGKLTNDDYTCYGASGSMGFVVPMIKFEVEIFKIRSAIFPQLPNAMTGAIKFRPKLGKFSPYAVLGAGFEFNSLDFDFDEYETFTFIGGGVYYKLAAMLSIRADIRFMNYSDFNRVRYTGGLFFSF